MRAEFTKAVRRDAFYRARGYCQLCGMKLRPGAVEYHHIIEAYLGGPTTLENCLVACKACHDVATKDRRPEIDKTRRLSDARLGIRKKPARPFPGSKRDKWKKRMDGSVESR